MLEQRKWWHCCLVAICEPWKGWWHHPAAMFKPWKWWWLHSVVMFEPRKWWCHCHIKISLVLVCAIHCCTQAIAAKQTIAELPDSVLNIVDILAYGLCIQTSRFYPLCPIFINVVAIDKTFNCTCFKGIEGDCRFLLWWEWV